MATTVGSASSATTDAASPVVVAATARAPGSEASSLRHWSSATGCEWISRISDSGTSAGPTRQWLTGRGASAPSDSGDSYRRSYRSATGLMRELLIGITPYGTLPETTA